MMQLREYLFYNRISIVDFAKSIGASRTYISTIVNGKAVPSKWLAKEIESATSGQVTVNELLNLKKDESANS